MTPKQTREYLRTILNWMQKMGQNYIDDDYVANGVWPDPRNSKKMVRLTFPLPLYTYREFHQSLGQEFTEEPFIAYQDMGFGQEYVNEQDGETWKYPENRLFFLFEGQKFVWRWMSGQGTAIQIILAGTFEHAVPFQEDKMIEIKA